MIDKNVKETFYDWCLKNQRNELLELWDYKLNKKSPSEIGSKSNLKYYFKCPRGLHESEAKYIYVITTQKKYKCNQCESVGQYVIDNHGESYLWSKWSDKNECSPFTIPHGSKKKIWVKCTEKNYHPDYLQNANSFVVGHKCPYCSGKKILPEDSFSGQRKNFIQLWSDKNTISPFEVSVGSEKIVYWKCENGAHEDYKRSMCHSNTYNYRCPKCGKEKQKTPLIDLTGEKFGYLTVLKIDEDKRLKTNRIYWKCKCRCGREKSILGEHLRSGRTKSCGCLHREKMSGIKKWDWSKVPPANYNYKLRRSHAYMDWRKKVFEKDNYTCQKCGATTNLQAHHKNNFIEFPEQRLLVSNGATLCKECHLNAYPNSFHSIYGVMNNTEDQFNEFIKSK